MILKTSGEVSPEEASMDTLRVSSYFGGNNVYSPIAATTLVIDGLANASSKAALSLTCCDPDALGLANMHDRRRVRRTYAR